MLPLAAAAAVPVAADGQALEESPPRGELWPLQALADETFAVSSRALALRRDVRMYQWRAETGVDGSVSWSREWSAESVRVPTALRDGEHVNPESMPFRGAAWRATAVMLDGHPVDASLYAHFDDWTRLAVDATSLPPNLAASFTSADGCVYSGEDAATPAIGDLRICWDILPAGPIEGVVRLDAGRWVAEDSPVARGTQREDFALDEIAVQNGGYWLLALLLPGFLLLVWVFRKRGRS